MSWNRPQSTSYTRGYHCWVQVSNAINKHLTHLAAKTQLGFNLLLLKETLGKLEVSMLL